MEQLITGVIYVRVSSDNQLENNGGHGLQSQETACREFAKNKNIEINRVFSDGGVSGKLLSREALDSMIAYLKKENTSYTKIHFVIVDDIDRISRDIVGRWSIKTNIETSGAKVLSLKQNLDNTPEGVLQQNIIMSFKQFERENNARRVRDRQRARMLDGFRPLYTPQGYKHEKGKDGKKQLVLVEPDAGIIKEGIELFALGMFQSKEDLKKHFISKQFATRRSKSVTRGFVDRLLQEATLLFYAGFIDYKPWGVQMIQANHPAIIDKEIIPKIMERLNPKVLHKKYTYSEIDEQMPLRSVLHCACCNHPLTGGPTVNRRGTTYFYYSCRQKGCEAYGKSFSSEKIHTQFEKRLHQLQIKKPVLDLLSAVCEDYRHDKHNTVEDQTKSVLKEIKLIDRHTDQLQDRILSTNDQKIITLYETKLRSFLDQKQQLEASLQMTDNSCMDAGKLFKECSFLLTDPLNIWKECDIESKRLLTRVLFGTQMTYGKISGLGTGDIPVIYSDLAMFNPTNSIDLEMIGIEPMSERDNDDFLPLESFNCSSGKLSRTTGLGYFLLCNTLHSVSASLTREYLLILAK